MVAKDNNGQPIGFIETFVSNKEVVTSTQPRTRQPSSPEIERAGKVEHADLLRKESSGDSWMKRPTRWELNRTIRELRADNERLERQVMELAEELAKRDKIIAELNSRV